MRDDLRSAQPEWSGAVGVEEVLSALAARRISPADAERALNGFRPQPGHETATSLNRNQAPRRRDAAWGEGVCQTVPLDNLEMYVEVYGQGQPLVLIHGWGVTGTAWRSIFRQPPSGHRVIVPDLRGHGRSASSGLKLSHRQFATDVLQLLDHFGIERCQAIGVSTGANTLIHMATRQPSRMEAMVLVGATSTFSVEAWSALSRIKVDPNAESYRNYIRLLHRQGDDQIRALLEDGNSLRESQDDMNFDKQDLAVITARTLIVHGDRDCIYPVQVAVDLHTAIGGSYLWIVPNGGHVPIILDNDFGPTAMAFLRGEWEGEPNGPGNDAGIWGEFWKHVKRVSQDVSSAKAEV